MERSDDLTRIRRGLQSAAQALKPFTPGQVEFERKEARGDPVTEADRAVDRALREALPEPGEGWLSEESADDRSRLQARRVWVVDPIDGTREFVEGIPEWCVSIGLIEDGEPVAGGILNPATGEVVVGARETGVTYNGAAARVVDPGDLVGVDVLASRSEVRRGEWKRFEQAPFRVRPCGSVAYKLALVAAGRVDVTFTLVPKHEWDVAAGVALVLAAGGVVTEADGRPVRFNQEPPSMPSLVAGGPRTVAALLAGWLKG